MDPFVLYRTDKFMIVYKPPHWRVDTTNSAFYRMNNVQLSRSLTNFRKPSLHVYLKLFIEENYGFKNNLSKIVCHRYDEQTSGGIMVALQDKYHNHCRNVINDKKSMIKIYVALLNGILKEKNGYIKKNISCSKSLPTYCKNMDFNKYSIDSMHSCTYYNVASEFEHKGKKYSLVHFRIFTGRTHQIRVHSKSLGLSIVSDDRYTLEKERTENKTICDRMFLHNIFLGFTMDNVNHNITIPLPYDLMKCLGKLKLIKRYNELYNFIELLNKKCY